MKNVEPLSPAASELRKRAEEALRETAARRTAAGGAEPDTQRLVHELQIHQIELEMQNEELKRSRSVTATLLESYVDLYDFAPVGYFTLDAEGVIRNVNLAGASLVGLPREGLIGRRLTFFVAPGSRTALVDFLGGVVSGRHGLTCDVSLLRNEGGAADVQFAGEAFEAVPECRVTAVDITRRMEAERELAGQRDGLEALLTTRTADLLRTNETLRKSEEKFRTVADFTWDWEAWRGPDGRFIYVSPSCERITGHTPAEFFADPDLVVRITHPDDREKIVEHLFRVAREARERDLEFDFRILRTSGETRWIGHSCTAVYDQGGALMGRRESNRDITERKRAEQLLHERTSSLAEANRELEAYSYSVSHELRTPLRAIDGFSARIARDYEGLLDDEGRRLFSQVRWNAQRMGQLIDDLLSFSQTGRADLQLAAVDMTGAARTAFAEVLSDPTHLGRISFSVSDLPEAHGDPLLLRRLWAVLLSNAVKFSAGRQRPEVRVEANLGGGSDGEVVYSVRDNGVGFDMKYVDKLFGVFQRLHGQNEFEGTGVGLALARRIVTRHGGRVWAEGAVDQGATFCFTLGTP